MSLRKKFSALPSPHQSLPLHHCHPSLKITHHFQTREFAGVLTLLYAITVPLIGRFKNRIRHPPAYKVKLPIPPHALFSLLPRPCSSIIWRSLLGLQFQCCLVTPHRVKGHEMGIPWNKTHVTIQTFKSTIEATTTSTILRAPKATGQGTFCVQKVVDWNEPWRKVDELDRAS